MIRLTALNDESSRSSEDDEVHPKEPPQEIQEENALKLYNEALQEQKNGNLSKAEIMYKQLLESNFLMKVKQDEENIKAKKPEGLFLLYSKPHLMLKYSCLKNLAVLSHKKNYLDEALKYYIQALEVENTDVSMWFQCGCIALKSYKITTALEAFLKGLEFSPNHWPSLDKLIMCLFVLHDYVNCLHFISRAFEIDANYTRGQVLRDYILQKQPSLECDIKIFFPKINLCVNKKSNAGKDLDNKLLNEVLNLSKEYSRKCKEEMDNAEEIKCYTPSHKIEKASWVSLGEFILQAEKEISEKEYYCINSAINLSAKTPNTEIHCEPNSEKAKESDEFTEDLGQIKTSDKENTKKATNGCGEKKKKSKGSALMEELLWSGKRRSARVRSSLRGNPEPMDVAEALRRILPRKLLYKTKQSKLENSPKEFSLEEDSMDTMDLYKLFEKQEILEEKKQEERKRCEVEQDTEIVVESEGYFGKKTEEDDVKSFISNEINKNIIDIIKSYIMSLKLHWKKTWPNPLPAIYIQCFQLMRKYCPLNFIICTTESNFKNLVEESGSVLLYGELYLEQGVITNEKQPTKLSSPLDIIFLQNVMELTHRREMFENDESYFEFLLRLYWLRCRIFLEKGQTNLAISALNDVLSCYDLFPQNDSTIIYLKNCRKHNVISKPIAEEFLAFQSKKRSLAEVVRLYEDESYLELTEILKDTFTTTPDTESNYFKEQESEMVDRQTQLSMLINGLYHLNEYKECIYWLETCCYEVLQKASSHANASAELEKESWMVTFDRFLIAMEDCLKLGNITVTKSLPSNRVTRFVQTLCRAICKELEDSDRPPCPARPWIILNTILIGLEAEQEKAEITVEDEEEENDIPSSILILFTAHEYLGRREWCNCNESILLFLIMDQVIPRMRNPEWSIFRETIQQHLEQVIYCLYSHPNKKAKARYLTDHNVNSIPLTWQRGIQLFDLFRPDEIPSYDSLRINLISSDTEVLFRRIAALIPDEKDPAQMSDKMTDFIVGKKNEVPMSSVKLPEPVKDLFYILGDYYFKTHEFAKAVNYLLIDLCANPDRVDSWASMALARASLLEQQLNSCDPLKDEDFLQNALSALRCYEHCLQLDNKQCALWIEYGSFLYTIHSFCSQRMKLESFNLSLEQFEELESTKNRMLETAKQAFVNANLIWYENENERQDERWLHHYMLGKICEKNHDFSYFEHYEKAAKLLYENEAEFPSKVGYTTPQTLAIEALEVYYRVHVCIIKNLELNEGKPLDSKTRQLFTKQLDICSNGPFAKQISKSELAKIKAKELEIAQKEKHLRIAKALLNDLISEIEKENAENGKEVIIIKEEKQNETILLDSTSDIEVQEAKVEVTPMKVEIYNSPTKKENQFLDHQNMEMNEEINVKKEKSSNFVPSKDQFKDKAPFGMHEEGEPMAIDLTVDSSGGFKNPIEIMEDGFAAGEQEASPSKIKQKRRSSQASMTSSSGASQELRYEDESSTSSTSSESSASSPSTSSSSSESSPSDTMNKEGSKATDDDEKMTAKNSIDEIKEECNETPTKHEINMMVTRCLKAFETCALRFPQHYKSVYRLAHFYFRSKEHKDISKCKDLLLGRYQTPGGTIPGLFVERKNTNFFNGIWRIPAGDVDRPGSFASHMSRSIVLLMEVLRDLKDHKMLLEICLQLKKTPEPDKKYLREDERNQLSLQACDLTMQILRKNVKESAVMTLPLVLDCYRCYQKIQKHYAHKENIYGDILLEAFKRLGKGDKCTLDQALRFCQSEVSTVKPKVPKNINIGLSVGSKSIKLKKAEKKKLTPKPQVAAKPVLKSPKVKKFGEGKKHMPTNILPQSILMDPAFWSSIAKPSTETKDPAKSIQMGAQLYAEMLRAAVLSIKQRDQMAMKNSDFGLKLPVDLMNSPGFFPFPTYPTSSMGKSSSSFWGNLPTFPFSSYGTLPGAKKSKSKLVTAKQHSVLKSNQQKTGSHSGKLEEASKPKTTNFNIEDILGKPSITVTKTSGSSPSPSSSAAVTGTGATTSSSSLSLIKSIEEKIKSISKEVNITKCSVSQPANFSRKNAPDAGKRLHSDSCLEVDVGGKNKKACREPDHPTASKKDGIELVVIDD